MSETPVIERELAPGARGPLSGVASTLSGIRFVVFRPASWRLAAVPALVASLLFFALASGAAAAAWSFTAGLRESVPGYLVSVLLVVVGVAFAGVLSLSLAQPISSAALDDLSRMREVSMGGQVRHDDGAFWPTAWRSLRVTTAALVVSVPVLVLLAAISVFVPVAAVVTVPLKFLLSSLVIAWDLLDYPFGLRGMGVRARLAWMRENLGAVTLFGASTGALLLIPLVGLFVLPCGVAAATELVVRAERDASRMPAKT